MQRGVFMYIECVKNNGAKYLRLVENNRIKVNDKTTTKKTLIKSIGPLSRFDDGEPDYLLRLRESFRNGNPLIDALLPYVDKKKLRKEYRFSFLEGDPRCIAEPKKYGHCLIEQILDELGVIAAINSYKSFSKLKYDVLGLFRLLVYGRILNPQSKIATFSQNSDYYENITDADYKYNIYDTLDFVTKHKKQIINRINSRLIQKAGRKNDIIFYDVTNFFYETEKPDDDYEDENCNTIKGFRKYGVCKEERKLPIVQMGLFMDESGMPISIEIFPGNTLDHQTVQPALSRSIDDVIDSRYIFIGDRGICNYANISHLLKRNKGYIVSKSIKKSTDEEKAWILDDSDYTKIGDTFKYKSRIVHKTIKDENGKKMNITEKVVSYWSKNFYDREIAENKSFLEFLDKLVEQPESFRITATQAKKIKKFLKSEFVNAETGELVDSKNLKTMVDIEAINKYKKFFGYYQIVTSELTMPDLEVIDKYHGLTQIENQFKIMKSDLETRPIYVHNPEHIEAHLTICLIGLIVLRIIQHKIVEYKKQSGTSKEGAHWEMGLTGERIQNALNKWNVINMDDTYYQMCNIRDEDLQLILKAFNLEIPNQFFTRGELKHIKNSIKIF